MPILYKIEGKNDLKIKTFSNFERKRYKERETKRQAVKGDRKRAFNNFSKK